MKPEQYHAANKVLSFISMKRRVFSGDAFGLTTDEGRYRTAALQYLRGNEFIKTDGRFYVLDRKGFDAMAIGGLRSFLDRQQDHEILDMAAKQAAIDGTRWNKLSIVTTIVLTLIAIGISFYGISQASKAEQNITRSDANVARAEAVLLTAQQERDSLHGELIEVRALVDSLRTPVPVPPVGKSKAR